MTTSPATDSAPRARRRPPSIVVLATSIAVAIPLLGVATFAFGAIWFGPGYGPATLLATLVIAGGAAAGIVLARRIAAPVREITGVARRVAAGDWTHRASAGGLRECAELAEALNDLLDALQRAAEENEALALYMNRVSRHALALRDMERRAIASELHDRVGQNLAAAQLTIRAVRSALEPLGGKSGDVAGHLAEAEKMLQAANERTRNVLTRLRPPLLDEFGIAAALESHARQMAARGSTLRVTVTADGPEVRLESTTEGVIFEVISEAIHNVEKHAMTEQAYATVRSTEDRVEFLVHDEGSGFDVTAQRADSWGIVGMRERIRNIGGSFEVRSAAGAGTDVRIVIPRRAAPRPVEPGAA